MGQAKIRFKNMQKIRMMDIVVHKKELIFQNGTYLISFGTIIISRAYLPDIKITIFVQQTMVHHY